MFNGSLHHQKPAVMPAAVSLTLSSAQRQEMQCYYICYSCPDIQGALLSDRAEKFFNGPRQTLLL